MSASLVLLPGRGSRWSLLRQSVAFAGEVTVAVLAAWLLGGGPWLAVLFMVLPVTAWNLLHPDRTGLFGTAAALAVAGAAMAADLAGWLPDDRWLPAGAEGDRAALAIGVVAALVLVVLSGVAARFARFARYAHLAGAGRAGGVEGEAPEAPEAPPTGIPEADPGTDPGTDPGADGGADGDGPLSRMEEAYARLKGDQARLVSSARLATVGDLVRGVAHEINTPLGALSSNYDVSRRALERLQIILEDEVVDQDELVEVRKIVKAVDGVQATNAMAVERMKKLVRTLRTFGRPDRSGIDRVDLHEALDSTLQILGHRLTTGIRVEREFGELPLVECYADQVNQVFMNLLVNALHALSGEGTITIRTRPEGEGVMVEVEDTGVGIREEDRERIFEPGFTTKGTRVGMGLGLPISSQIVDRHGGEISVESRVGQGTTVRVWLPVRLPEDMVDETVAEPGRGEPG